MSSIELIDSSNYNKVDRTPYNVATQAAEIDTKKRLIAQTILNRANETQTQVQTIQSDIDAIQSDINAAVSAGATAPGQSVVDITGLTSSLATLATDAASLA